MRYTQEEGGRLNNYAIEPKIYEAAPPSKTQQRNYLIMGAAAIALVGSLLFVAVSASSVG